MPEDRHKAIRPQEEAALGSCKIVVQLLQRSQALGEGAGTDQGRCKVVIQAESGSDTYEADVPCDTELRQLAAEFAKLQGWTMEGPLVVEFHDLNQARRSSGAETIREAGIRDGDVLLISPPTAGPPTDMRELGEALSETAHDLKTAAEPGASPRPNPLEDKLALRAHIRRERQRLRRSLDGPILQAELKSLDRLKHEFGDLLHDLRPLGDFNAWLRLPGRQKLFNRVCRFVTAEDWYTSVADLGSVPWIFRSHEERRRHLGHCPYCRIQLRLAEGRYRKELAGAPNLLSGDQFAEDLIKEACRDALLAALAVPIPGADLGPGVSPFDLSAPRLRVAGLGEYKAVNGHLLVPARLEGDPRHQQVELAVVAEFVSRECEAGRPALVFPNPRHPEPLLSLAQGTAPLALLVPRPQSPGRYFFRYCTCPYDGSGPRRLPDLFGPRLGPEAPPVRTRGGGKAALVPAARPSDSTPGPVQVAAGVVTLDWGG
jgi:hypothetical protein